MACAAEDHISKQYAKVCCEAPARPKKIGTSKPKIVHVTVAGQGSARMQWPLRDSFLDGLILDRSRSA